MSTPYNSKLRKVLYNFFTYSHIHIISIIKTRCSDTQKPPSFTSFDQHLKNSCTTQMFPFSLVLLSVHVRMSNLLFIYIFLIVEIRA
jgi:hypothetical protein